MVTVAKGNPEPGESDEASGWSKLPKDGAVFELFTGGLETDEVWGYLRPLNDKLDAFEPFIFSLKAHKGK